MSCNVTIIAGMTNKKIDLTEYCTQSEYAKLVNKPLGLISQWVKRTKENTGNTDKHLDILYVPELNMTLIRRP